jgi:hypothetical protein
VRREEPRRFYGGSIGVPLYRLHPAFGARPVSPDERRIRTPLVERELPPTWLSLTDDQQDDAYEGWLTAVLTAVAALGPSRIHLETSDQHGLDVLRAQPGVTQTSPVAFVGNATPEMIDAVIRTNVARLVQTVEGTPVLTVVDAWSGMFLHVADPTLLGRFGDLW